MARIEFQQFISRGVKPYECYTGESIHEEGEFMMVMLGRLIKKISNDLSAHKDYYKKDIKSSNKLDRNRARTWHMPIIKSLRASLKKLKIVESSCLKSNDALKSFMKSRGYYEEFYKKDIFSKQKILTKYDIKDNEVNS